MTRKIYFLPIFMLLAAFTVIACSSNDSPTLANSDAQTSTDLPNADSDAKFEKIAEKESSISNAFFQNAGDPLVEECCTAVGKMDECWWEDAIQDGITCRSHADCATELQAAFPVSGMYPNGACYIRGDDPIGVCRCNPNVETHCSDNTVAGQERDGICTTDTDENIDICGPSFCNGYLKCSCFGGCEWWDQENPTKTPWDNADTDNNVFCCEGSYPLGGDKIVTFYGNGGCDAASIGQCINDADCNDSNPCTTHVCTANRCEESTAVPLGTACGSTECSTSACNGTGTCVPSAINEGGLCGTDTVPTDCVTNKCHSGLCQPADVDNNTPCGVDSNDTDCYGPTCQNGTCDTASPLPAETSCGAGVDTVPDDCFEGWECDGSGNCLKEKTPAGTTCAFDEVTYHPSCWAAYCGLVTDNNWSPTFHATDFNGDCTLVQRDAPSNDTCAGAMPLGTGTISNTLTGTVATVTASTHCATNDYSAAHSSCVEPTDAQLGAGANDVVYYFDYTATSSSQQDLYAFVVTVESDIPAGSVNPFRAVVYTQNDTCDGTSSNKCLYHSEGLPVPWEYRVNTLGQDWNAEDQHCAAGDYEWCQRTYTGAGSPWTYPDSPTECIFNNTSGSYDCGSTAGNVAQTVVFPVSNQDATTERVYVFVDGAGSQSGTFTLTLERVLWNNGACERVTDAPRVYDITEIPTSGTGVYQGNLTGYANSDHSSTSTTCGGYDCSETWEGWTASHGGSSGDANAFWPNAAYFKIQPSANTEYCLKTDQGSISNAITPVVEVRHLTQSGNNEKDLCQGAYTQETVGLGEDGVEFSALAGNTYLVLVSEEGPNAAADGPCTTDCNYKLTVTEGACPVPCVTTTYQGEDTYSNGTAAAGGFWNLYSDGSFSTSHTFTTETTIQILAYGTWGVDEQGTLNYPHMFLTIDGVATTPALDTIVANSSVSPHIYAVTLDAAPVGPHTVAINFDNDANETGDRNLLVDYFSIGCDEIVDAPNTLVIEEVGISDPYVPGSTGLCSVDTGGKTQNAHGGNGFGYANTDNASGKTVEWSVEASQAGNVTLQWIFASGEGNRPGTLRVNEADIELVNMDYTGAWNIWDITATHTITLNAGTNSIELVATTDYGLANIDNMTVVGVGLSEGNCQ